MSFDFSTAELKNKLDGGDVDNGYVNLGASNNNTDVASNQNLNGQDYSVTPNTNTNSNAINDPCKGSDAFNRKFEDKVLTNENGSVGHVTPGSDESEKAPTKKEEDKAAAEAAAAAEQ